MLTAPVLRPGDHVRLVSPASFPSQEWLSESVAILESWDLVAEVGRHALDQHGFMAGTDQHRLDDLNDAFRDESVRAIITTRGGAGAYRIAGELDFDAVRADPKPLIGFSDITHLHLALWRHCRLASAHGNLDSRALRRLLTTSERTTVTTDPKLLSAALTTTGRASGPLIGGNLSAMAFSIGTDLPELNDAILLIEATRTVGIGQVDRALTQLIRSGSLHGVRGVAVGLLDGFEDFSDRGWTVLDVFRDRLATLDVPVLGGFPIGHSRPGYAQHCVALGPTATIDADEGTLTSEPCVR